MKNPRLGRWARAARCCFFVLAALCGATNSHSQTPTPPSATEQADLVVENFARGDLVGWTIIGGTLRVQDGANLDAPTRRVLQSMTVHELTPRRKATSPQPDKPSESASVRPQSIPRFGAIR